MLAERPLPPCISQTTKDRGFPVSSAACDGTVTHRCMTMVSFVSGCARSHRTPGAFGADGIAELIESGCVHNPTGGPVCIDSAWNSQLRFHADISVVNLAVIADPPDNARGPVRREPHSDAVVAVFSNE